MNQKLSRALRRAKTKTLQLIDEPRIVRYYGRIGALAEMGPKFKKERVNKPSAQRAPSWPRTKDQLKQTRPMIVLNPMRHIKARLVNGLTIGGLTGYWAKNIHELTLFPKFWIDHYALKG